MIEIKREIKNIYVDMDGVLVDPIEQLAIQADMYYHQFEQHLNVLSAIGKRNEFLFPLIHKVIETEGFIKVSPNLNFIRLKYWMESWKYSGYNVQILTSLMKDNPNFEELKRQKILWLAKHELSEYPAIFVNGSELKQNYSTPDSLLIDDYPRNINQWISKGGVGILYTDIYTTRDILIKLGINK